LSRMGMTFLIFGASEVFRVIPFFPKRFSTSFLEIPLTSLCFFEAAQVFEVFFFCTLDQSLSLCQVPNPLFPLRSKCLFLVPPPTFVRLYLHLCLFFLESEHRSVFTATSDEVWLHCVSLLFDGPFHGVATSLRHSFLPPPHHINVASGSFFSFLMDVLTFLQGCRACGPLPAYSLLRRFLFILLNFPPQGVCISYSQEDRVFFCVFYLIVGDPSVLRVSSSFIDIIIII